MPKPDPAVQQFRSPAWGGWRSISRPAALAGRAVLVLALAASDGAQANDLDIGVGVVSNVLVRGIALNSDSALPHASIDYYAPAGWFLGMTADLVKPDEYHPESGQLSARAGYAWSPIDNWSVQFGYLHYAYPASSYLRTYAYDEFSASLAWRDLLAFTFAASPNTKFGRTSSESTVAYDLTGRYPVSEHLSLIGGIGYRDLHRLFDTGYIYGNGGVELRFGQVLVGLAYVATNSDAKRLFGSKAADRWTGSVMWHF